MHPELFHIGPLTIRTYGLAMATAFLLSYWLAAQRAPRESIDPELVLDNFLSLFIGAIIGARLIYIFSDIHSFIKSPLEIFKIWKGGLVFYGGFLGGMLGTYIYLKRKKHGFWRVMDLMAPYAGLGYAIHRTFGCFAGFGCCYGRPTDLPWGVVFPEGSPAALDKNIGFGVPVHPTQLYESINGLIIMAVIIIYRRHPHRIGRPSAIFLLIYSTLRFSIEFLRGDIYRGFLGPLSTSQWISIPLFALAFILWFRKSEEMTPLDKEKAKKLLDDLLKDDESVNSDADSDADSDTNSSVNKKHD